MIFKKRAVYLLLRTFLYKYVTMEKTLSAIKFRFIDYFLHKERYLVIADTINRDEKGKRRV